MGNYKAVSTPLATHFKLSVESYPQAKMDIENMSRVPYSIAVGSLMYFIVCTRLDLSHVVSVVSCYIHNPGKDHWDAVKFFLRYVKCSINIGLVFDRNKATTSDVIGFNDSNYVSDLDKRRSILGYIVTICATAISWIASLQSIAALLYCGG